jgi:CO/xanthine dehydrogenase FAD-binding subunit
MLKGKTLGAKEAKDTFAEAARLATAEVDPHEDVHASSSYRRHLAGVMAQEALEKAFARSGGH